jgi:membrane protein YqaA with SNARE-associated domain
LFNIELELIFLLLVSFFAATIFPAQSEILLAVMYSKGDISPILLLAVASIGNITGSCVNWLIGFYIRRFQGYKWFRINQNQMIKSSDLFRKYGLFTLLFAWVPFVGDPLTIVAGIFRVPFFTFIILVGMGKIARYIAILYFLGFEF